MQDEGITAGHCQDQGIRRTSRRKGRFRDGPSRKLPARKGLEGAVRGVRERNHPDGRDTQGHIRQHRRAGSDGLSERDRRAQGRVRFRGRISVRMRGAEVFETDSASQRLLPCQTHRQRGGQGRESQEGHRPGHQGPGAFPARGRRIRCLGRGRLFSSIPHSLHMPSSPACQG